MLLATLKFLKIYIGKCRLSIYLVADQIYRNMEKKI